MKNKTYHSSLSKAALKSYAIRDRVPIKDWIHKSVKDCGINEKKLAYFWDCVHSYLNYLEQHPNAKEEPQRSEGLKKRLLNNVFPSSQVGEVIRGNEDLSILDKSQDTRVIIEYKSLTNKNEMMSIKNFNRKALAEVIEYYLAERCGYYIRNNHLQYIRSNHHTNKKSITGIVTNGYQWFIIPNQSLENYFGRSSLMSKYLDWCKNGHLQSAQNDNTYFQKEYISTAIDKALRKGISIGYFNLKAVADKKHASRFTNKQKRFFQFLSPQELLQEGLKIAPNKLNRKFYNELLYIIGLKQGSQDPKDKAMHRIGYQVKDPQKKEQLRHKYRATLIEQICNLNSHIHFDEAVNIAMSFINRVLFLKLLEGSLEKFNPNRSKDYQFMTYGRGKITNFNDMRDLFFRVMNNYPNLRQPASLRHKYEKIPYLNSSLFTPTNIEVKYHIDPSSLDSSLFLPIYKNSTLNKYQPNSTKSLPILKYLLDFLSHYRFRANSHSVATGEGPSGTSQVINSAILGMVFEKINGYRQGSYFTPDYIAAHMAKTSINAMLSNKLNHVGIRIKNPNYLIKDYKEFVNNEAKTSTHRNIIKNIYSKKISKIINSVKIVDPAVGSGHFLVAALNYLIYLKFNLHILISSKLSDTKANLSLHYTLKYDNNGQLWLWNAFGKQFEYQRYLSQSVNIQKAFFNAKEYIIKNNLYGVDINPNSVDIARLRLWIELLKDAYYDLNGHMVTMPNLKTNIKVGNSLMTHAVMKHPYTFSPAVFKKLNISLKDLRNLITAYKSHKNKNEEHLDYIQISDSINRMVLFSNMELLNQKYKQTTLFDSNQNQSHLTNLLNQIDFYMRMLCSHPVKRWNDLLKLDTDLINIIKNRLTKLTGYTAFEWHYEFPELLTIKNNKILSSGFDLIITNPPYIPDKFSTREHQFFIDHYSFSKYQFNSFELFIELSLYLTKNGFISMIIPNTFFSIGQFQNVRDYLFRNTGNISILNSKDRIFPEAAVDNCIILLSNCEPTNVRGYWLENHQFSYIGETNPKELIGKRFINIKTFGNSMASSILNTLVQNGTPIVNQKARSNGGYTVINNTYGSVKDGVKLYEGGKGLPKQPVNKRDSKGHKIGHAFDNFKNKNPYVKKLSAPIPSFDKRFLGKNTMGRYHFKWDHKYIKYGPNLAAKRNIDVFNGPRLLVSRVLRNGHVHTLKVAYTKSPYICVQGIETIHPKGIDPLVMMAVLNSRCLGFYVIAELGLLQRSTFPQIQVNQIRGLLIPNLTEDNANILKSDTLAIMSSQNNRQINKLQENIDRIVEDSFKLSKKQCKYLNSFSVKGN